MGCIDDFVGVVFGDRLIGRKRLEHEGIDGEGGCDELMAIDFKVVPRGSGRAEVKTWRLDIDFSVREDEFA